MLRTKQLRHLQKPQVLAWQRKSERSAPNNWFWKQRRFRSSGASSNRLSANSNE